MARILYGVMGDSRGHLSRSQAVVQSMPHHEFLFVGGGTVHELKAQGYHVEDVPMAATIRRNNRVDFPATLANAARVFLGKRGTVRRLADIIKNFDPDLILTDYEFFTPLAARFLGRTCVSIDHQHVLTHCRYRPPAGQGLNRLLTCGAIRHLYSTADRFFVISFYQLPAENPAITEVFPPVVRAEVKLFTPSTGDHVVVYLPDRTFKALLPVLEERSEKFIIYGMGEAAARRNLTFKRKSRSGFLQDLASCRYVISNAGHSLISESLYYGKPVVAFPREFEYEQFLNAHFLAEFGYGEYCTSAEVAGRLLDKFALNLERCEARIRQEQFFGNEAIAARLESLIRKD